MLLSEKFTKSCRSQFLNPKFVTVMKSNQSGNRNRLNLLQMSECVDSFLCLGETFVRRNHQVEGHLSSFPTEDEHTEKRTSCSCQDQSCFCAEGNEGQSSLRLVSSLTLTREAAGDSDSFTSAGSGWGVMRGK